MTPTFSHGTKIEQFINDRSNLAEMLATAFVDVTGITIIQNIEAIERTIFEVTCEAKEMNENVFWIIITDNRGVYSKFIKYFFLVDSEDEMIRGITEYLSE